MIDEPNSTDTLDQSFSLAHYRQLAELRFRIRQYLQFSEQVARTYGLEPQQHQLMLAIKGLPLAAIPTVSALANRLCLRHHSTVELINRLVERGAAVRKPSTLDRRQVLVELTPLGEELLEKLNTDHNSELQSHAHELLDNMTNILNGSTVEANSASSVAAGSDSSPVPIKKLEAASAR